RRPSSQMTRGLAVAITRRRSSQIAGLALLSPVGASLRQPKHWQCCIKQRCNVVNLIKLSFFVNTR
ncbi:hypothetical protein, partial [Proteus mirabilis]|uniref:hypothetical protein n=2 Tax=Proteus mirabilis TaxID=584 RepID=UPI00298C97DD